MRPLDPLTEIASPLSSLLDRAPAEQVREELDRLQGEALAPPAAAALTFAGGALALREGRLDDACAALESGADAFAACGLTVEAALARCESWLARIRRGPRPIYPEAIAELGRIAAEHQGEDIVWVVATHYRATAMRFAGHAEDTLRLLLDALSRSEALLAERAQVLNSLGTIYVVMGAYGAAQAMLEHAAELNHQLNNRVGEAISYGQLGTAALARGELEAARRYLQKQEWYASQVGDSFGRARALVLLGDLAMDLGRPDDALELAKEARGIAGSVQPPLAMWIAYATRTIGRAKVEMGDPDAEAELKSAAEQFQRMGNQLGDAFVTWDLAHHAFRSAGRKLQDAGWQRAAWAFAGLGLTGRVAQVLRDARSLADEPERRHELEVVMAATAQSYPHIGTPQEVRLVYDAPATLADIATRRIEGQRNLGRLAALSLGGRGLVVAALASAQIGGAVQAAPGARASAALIGQLPGAAVWAWPKSCALADIARDLSAARAALGDDTRVALASFADARITATPFAGELSARLVDGEIAPLIACAVAAPGAELSYAADVAWDNDAEALARLAGYRTAAR